MQTEQVPETSSDIRPTSVRHRPRPVTASCLNLNLVCPTSVRHVSDMLVCPVSQSPSDIRPTSVRHHTRCFVHVSLLYTSSSKSFHLESLRMSLIHVSIIRYFQLLATHVSMPQKNHPKMQELTFMLILWHFQDDKFTLLH